MKLLASPLTVRHSIVAVGVDDSTVQHSAVVVAAVAVDTMMVLAFRVVVAAADGKKAELLAFHVVVGAVDVMMLLAIPVVQYNTAVVVDKVLLGACACPV